MAHRTFFHTLKQGTRIEQRHLNAAEDRRKGRAFDAITAFRVWDLALRAQTKPEVLAQNSVRPEDIRRLLILACHPHQSKSRDPPEITMSQFVVLVAGLVGFHPSKRQRRPGTQKLWEGMRIFNHGGGAIQTYQEYQNSKRKIKMQEASMLN